MESSDDGAYFVVSFLVVRPHVKGALHQQLSEVTQVSLERSDGFVSMGLRSVWKQAWLNSAPGAPLIH